MVDVHCHILPGIDDGARNLEESLAIGGAQREGGTHVMIATPHVESSSAIDRSDELVGRVEQLNTEFASNGLNLKVAQGAELFPCMAILKGIENGRPITLGGSGKYVLLDLPHSVLPLDFDTIVFELLAHGITPILAHPERCPAFRKDPFLIDEYRHKGVVFQLNSGSFVGRHGEQAQQMAQEFFDRRCAHFLASDAHRKGRNSLGSVVQRLKTPENADYLAILTKRSGEAVLAGEPLPVLPPPPEREEAPVGFFSWVASKLRPA